jgi:hypothetical protein
MSTSGDMELWEWAADDSREGARNGHRKWPRVLSQALLVALALILDGSTVVAVGASILVDLGATGNLTKAVFCSLLVADALALNASPPCCCCRGGEDPSCRLRKMSGDALKRPQLFPEEKTALSR